MKLLKSLWRFLRPLNKKTLFPTVGFTYGLLSWLLIKTVRIKYIGRENEDSVLKNGRKFILGFWDGRHIILYPVGIGKNLVTVASFSDAGELLSHIHRFFTISCLRGSSSSGGTRVLKKIIRALKQGKNGVVAVDGPRGPIEKAKPGIIQMAKMSGAVILPLSGAVRHKIVIKKLWYRLIIPLPFTSGVRIFGKPIEVPAGTNRQEMNELLISFQSEMDRITDLAEKLSTPGTG